VAGCDRVDARRRRCLANPPMHAPPYHAIVHVCLGLYSYIESQPQLLLPGCWQSLKRLSYGKCRWLALASPSLPL
jgi:hypothetical protein